MTLIYRPRFPPTRKIGGAGPAPLPFSARPLCVTVKHINALTPRPAPDGGPSQTEVFVASIEYSQVRKGMVIVGDDGQLYYVVDRNLNTPGNWRAQLKLKLKSLKTGAVTEQKVHPDGKVEQAYLDKRDMQYIYQDGDGYVFMDTETYDQVTLPGEMVGEQMLYLKE